MVSSGAVNGDLSALSNLFSKFDSSLSGLSSSWKGQSYDNFKSRTSEFSSSFLNTLNGQMTAFASACDLYEKYKSTKQAMENAQNNAMNATDPNVKSQYNQQAANYQSELADLKSQIESNLAAASSEVLEATSLSGGAFATITDWADDNNFVYYNQSGGWNDYRYSAGGANTMGASGCGPTSAAMVAASFGFDITPNEAADWRADHGYHDGDGTDHGFFTAYGDELGIPNKQMNVSSENLANALSQGDLVILSANPGDFTNYGHFIVARSYNPETNEVLIADPNHTSNCHWWDLDRVANQCKNSWAYGPGIES